jgi:hypothetical protein
MKNLVDAGSKTAKDGFKNENDVIDKFNNWKNDNTAKEWLKAMNYNLNKIEYVKAIKIKGSFKSDVQVQISVEIKLKTLLDVQNLQVKLVSNPNGFNQIDKRWIEKYIELWNIPPNISRILKYFTGELEPYIKSPKDNRRFLLKNKILLLILSNTINLSLFQMF